MPTADEVVVRLRADVDGYQRSIAGAENAFTRSVGKMEGATSVAARSIGNGFRGMAGAIGLVSAGAAAATFLQMADAAKSVEAQLRLATAQTGNFAKAQDDVRRISQETRSGLEATAGLYGSFIRNARDLGISQADAARATETVTKAFKVSSASTAEAEGATRQLSQALQSGALRGDEFNSVNEQAPRIMRLLADSMGVPIGELRTMAEEGQLTSDKLVRALTDTKFTEGLDTEFKQLPVTFDDAMTTVRNAAVLTFGAFDRGGEFSTSLANFVSDGSDGLEGLGEAATDTGITTRAAFAGLGDAFDPLLQGALSALGLIDGKVQSTRELLASMFKLYDDIANFDANIENSVKGWSNRNLGTAFGMSRVSNTEGTYRRAVRSGEARVAEQNVQDKFGFGPGGAQSWLDGKRDMGKPPARPTKKQTAAERNANAEVGKEWSASEVAALLRSRGIRVTGVDRTPAQQQAQIDKWEREDPRTRGIRPAGLNGPHVRRKGVDIGREHSIANIKAILKEAGVPIAQLLNEGDHKHLTIGKGRGAGGKREKSAEQIARDAEQARVREEARRQGFEDELAGIQADLLSARKALVTSEETLETFARQEIEAARVAYNDKLTSSVSRKQLTQAEADQLKVVNDQVAAEKVKGIELQKQARLAREASAAADRRLEGERADLQNQTNLAQIGADAARTAEERRQSAHRLLDLQYQLERLEQRAIIAASERVLADEQATAAEKLDAQAAKDRATARLGTLDKLENADRGRVDAENRSPLDQYRADITKTGGELNEDFQRVAVDGLQSLNDGLTEAIMGAESLQDVFSRVANAIIADLIRIAIQQMIVKPLLESMSGGMSGGGGGIGGFISGLFGRASGGHISGGRMYRVNEGAGAGKVEGFVPAGQGKIVPLGRMNVAAPSGGGAMSVSMPIHLNAPGADPAQLARLRQEINTLRAELPARIVGTLADARSRNVIR